MKLATALLMTATVCLILLIGLAHAQVLPDSDRTPLSCDGKTAHFHQQRVKRIVDGAYALDRFLDPTPAKQSEKDRWREHRRCILDPERRFRMSEYVDRAQDRFDAYRKQQLAITPYHFGEPTIPYVAIPPYIVRCETRGYYGASRWGAVNASSGARGPYQMLPSTYAGVCDRCDWSHPDQHLAASRVYARSGGSEWVCA